MLLCSVLRIFIVVCTLKINAVKAEVSTIVVVYIACFSVTWVSIHFYNLADAAADFQGFSKDYEFIKDFVEILRIFQL